MKDMNTEERNLFLMQYTSLKKDRNIALILSVLFGYLGADQFYIGKNSSGYIKIFLTILASVFYFIFPIFVTLIVLGILGFIIIGHWSSIQDDADIYNRTLGNNIQVFINKLSEEKNSSK